MTGGMEQASPAQNLMAWLSGFGPGGLVALTLGVLLIGVLFLGVIQNGLTLSGVSSFWQGMVSGLILIMAVWLGGLRQLLRRRRLSDTSKQH